MNLTASAYIVILRGVALVLSLQGQEKVANTFYKLAAAAELGLNVDSHMEIVAQQLERQELASWDDINARVDKEVEEFLSRGADGQVDNG